MYEHMELSSSQRGWESDPPHRPLLMSFWIKSGFSQTRPDCGFALFGLTSSRWGTMRPAACRHACHSAPSGGESEMESRTMNSSLSESDQSAALEPFSVCLRYPSEDAHKPNMRCDNVWKPQTDLKMLAENMPTPDPHKLTRCCETVTVYAISVCSGDRKCHWIPPRTGSWRLVICWKGSCHGDIWVL